MKQKKNKQKNYCIESESEAHLKIDIQVNLSSAYLCEWRLGDLDLIPLRLCQLWQISCNIINM